ncbi:hypothetical protein AV530_018242 [Patagioenas fasciata monilis]|uniref:Uncharacterized protein n=1 Tax=Patagioenas fasciata monilis TaxID=372326 RepID=A0A1V4JR71_PATFA|nr:hypothetical protein AV530_018242 [Patagioenas fasciata monilis]
MEFWASHLSRGTMMRLGPDAVAVSGLEQDKSRRFMNISGDQPPGIQLVLHKTHVHSLSEAIWILSDTHIEPLLRSSVCGFNGRIILNFRELPNRNRNESEYCGQANSRTKKRGGTKE